MTAAPSSEVDINFCCCPAQMRRSRCWHLRQKGCTAPSAFITRCHTRKKFRQSFSTGVALNHSAELSLNCCYVYFSGGGGIISLKHGGKTLPAQRVEMCDRANANALVTMSMSAVRCRWWTFLQQLQDLYLSFIFLSPLTSISKKPRWALAGARFLEGEETRGLFRYTKGRAATGRCVTVRRSSGANVSGEHRSARRRCDKQGWTRMSWNAALYAQQSHVGTHKTF